MKAARMILSVLAGAGILVSLLHAAAHLGLFPAGSALSAATYTPVWWLGAFAFLVCVACWLGRARKASMALLASFAVGVLPHSDFSWRSDARQPDGTAAKLSVVALNVQYYAFGVDSVAQALKQIDADVALLSENVLDETQAEAMSAALRPRSFRMGKSGETAIVSKYPILDFKEVELPTFQASLTGPNRLDEAEPKIHRSFSHAVLDVGGALVNVLSVRLIAGRAPTSGLLSQIGWGLYLVRAQNAEVEFLKRYLARLKGPFVIGGDLNAPPSAPAVQSLRLVATDAYLATHHLGKATFRVRAPLLRIDYVLASPELTPISARRVDMEVSDHFPVFAEFQLSPQRAQAATRSSNRGL